MLQLTYGQAGEKIIVTLNELKTLTDPYYLFRFKHVETKQVVSLIFAAAVDESPHPARYNQFNVATVTSFLDKPVGEWHYSVYEQASSSNTDPEVATGLLEKGKLLLLPASEYELDAIYGNDTTFKAYQG